MMHSPHTGEEDRPNKEGHSDTCLFLQVFLLGVALKIKRRTHRQVPLGLPICSKSTCPASEMREDKTAINIVVNGEMSK